MKLLTLDLESAPAQVAVWDLKADYVHHGNVLKPRRVICIAYKWYGEEEVGFLSEWDDGHDQMIRAIHALIDEADGIISFNGQSYDLPMLNTEFIMAGLAPPSPYVHIDLMRACRRQARFMSNSLDYLTSALGVGRKGDSGGMKTWLAIENGDADAMERCARYCKIDVEITEHLYRRLLPWIPGHPSRAIMDQSEGCPRCGGMLRPRGWSYTRTGRYHRFACDDCGGWSRSTRREDFTEITAA